MDEIPWAVIGPLLGVVTAIAVALLLDLRRRDPAHLPRWAWALIIVFVSFPVGALLYWFIGRGAPRGSAPPPDPTTRVDANGHTLGHGLADRPPWEPDGPVVLATRALHKQYDIPAVDGVDLRVPAGSTYGLIGPNGSGKTTLLSMIAGLRTPTSGTIDLEVPRTRMALLADTPEFEPWLTAHEVVDLARHLVAPDFGPDAVEAALHEVGLLEAADRRVGGFSRGMLQRVGLATCLVGDPQLLLLDEPSSALDPAGRREVLDLIARLAGERTVVLSTHVLTDVQQACDIVGVLQHGRLVFQGPLDVLLAHTDAVYRLRVTGAADAVATALRQQPWLADLEVEGPGTLRLRVIDIAAAERDVPGVLDRAGARLHAFGPAADLESAFLALTGRPA
jgi:ABC-2 type transport system ATP-binding protein